MTVEELTPRLPPRSEVPAERTSAQASLLTGTEAPRFVR